MSNYKNNNPHAAVPVPANGGVNGHQGQGTGKPNYESTLRNGRMRDLVAPEGRVYHLLAGACWQASEAIGVFFGYRLISFGYEDGSGRDYQRYDLTEQGPLVGMSVSF